MENDFNTPQLTCKILIRLNNKIKMLMGVIRFNMKKVYINFFLLHKIFFHIYRNWTTRQQWKSRLHEYNKPCSRATTRYYRLQYTCITIIFSIKIIIIIQYLRLLQTFSKLTILCIGLPRGCHSKCWMFQNINNTLYSISINLKLLN